MLLVRINKLHACNTAKIKKLGILCAHLVHFSIPVTYSNSSTERCVDNIVNTYCTLVSCSQTPFCLIHWDGKKGSGTSTVNFCSDFTKTGVGDDWC